MSNPVEQQEKDAVGKESVSNGMTLLLLSCSRKSLCQQKKEKMKTQMNRKKSVKRKHAMRSFTPHPLVKVNELMLYLPS